MLNIRKINPAVRAVGTMGAVAATVGIVTFATITSNTVALTNNTLAAATATLEIGLTNDCSDGGASKTGMSFTDLVPGTESSQFAFCIKNTGNTPLSLTMSSPTNFTGSTLNPNDVTLHFTCGVGGATTGAVDVSTSVGGLSSPQAFGGSPLNNSTNNVYTCRVTAKITGGLTVASGASINTFEIDYSGSAGS